MFVMHGTSNLGMTGFFTEAPSGAVTITKRMGWVTNDLEDLESTLHTDRDIAHSALIQGF